MDIINFFCLEWQQIAIELIGAFFGFGFALWLFYLQIKKDRKKAEKQKLDSYKDLLSYYKELLKSSITTFNTQLDDLDDYIKRQEANMFNLEPIKFNVTNDFLRIKNIDNKGVFEAWTTLFSDEDTIKLYKNNNARTDFLEKHFLEIERMHKENTKHNYDLLSEVRNIINHIPDTLAMMSRHLRLQLGDKRKFDPEYRVIQMFIGTYTELVSKKADFESLNIEFIYPLLDFYLENSDLYNTDEIIMLCKKARVKLENIKDEQEQSIENYREIRPDTKKHIEELEKTIKKIDDLLGTPK